MRVSQQIGWSQESNLLWEILKQLNKLAGLFKPKYKVYTALLTQSGGSGTSSLNDEPLTIGVTYLITDLGGSGWDFTNVGAPNNNNGTYFVATGTTPNSWGDLGVSLDFIIGAPVVTVLENTIGNIWLTYLDTGRYQINSNALFTSGKTFIHGAKFGGQCIFNRMIADDATGFASQVGYFLTVGCTSSIQLKTIADVEVFGDGVISDPICLEIRVYN